MAAPQQPTANGHAAKHSQAVTDYLNFLGNPGCAVAVAAIQSLTGVVQRSNAQTVMGLEKELDSASAALEQVTASKSSLAAGCALFKLFVTRMSVTLSEQTDFEVIKNHIIKRGHDFAAKSQAARSTIALLGRNIIRHGEGNKPLVVLVHSYSRVVLELLKVASQPDEHSRRTYFRVMVTEGRPDDTGIKMAKALEEMHIPCTIVLDSAMAQVMDRVDVVLVGAEAVAMNGGIINKLGTYTLALVAHAHNKGFYVAAESYKFVRIFPLNQRDFPNEPATLSGDALQLAPPSAEVLLDSRDYTPPEYITMLVTDLGILTPAAVGDELLQLYH